ncbi:MAG: UpxY family transcription antiterminator [Haliscomenobacter sp.]|nr:UpxY family transcription antiterminator [Haliscomenobacter sp.]MBK9487673.1 UpxY family transcription antiterminator [Haliscomenobacter sp.]
MLDALEPRWFAVYTKYKREKLVSKYLQDKGITSYLPLQTVTRMYTRKIKKIELPLINCYVFVQITKDQYVPVLETPDVVNFVKIAKDLIAIPEAEIEILRRVTGDITNVEVDKGVFKIGEEVEIISGSLFGLRGRLLQGLGSKNFVIELENLGYSLRMQMAPEILRPLPGTRGAA